METANNYVKIGQIKKRSARMHQWTTRHFILSNRTLSYKLKESDPNPPRGSFDLVPGCIVTQIEAESRGTMKGKKIYSFWLVWPHDKTSKDTDLKESPESEDEKEPMVANVPQSSSSLTIEEGQRKNLKQIVESEVMTQRRQKSLVEEQIEMHHARDNNINLGAKVAAVAVGGVVVGGLTAGIGLIPYLAVVAVTAAAGGGAVAYNWRKPADSRLILGCDSMEEAIEWRAAIEHQIVLMEEALKPSLPATVDPKVISSILDRSSTTGLWQRVSVVEGMRIMEHIASSDSLMIPQNRSSKLPMKSLLHTIASSRSDARSENPKSNRCRRAQISVQSTPINTFLQLMNVNTWPTCGTSKVIKGIDDHADLIGIEINTRRLSQKGVIARQLCFSRFWKLEDDGVYLITYNSTHSDYFPSTKKTSINDDFIPCDRVTVPNIDAVITVAPRADFADYEYDMMDSIVSCSCQVSSSGDWDDAEASAFMDEFLRDQLLELRANINSDRFSFNFGLESSSAYGVISHLSSQDGAENTPAMATAAAMAPQVLAPSDLSSSDKKLPRSPGSLKPSASAFREDPPKLRRGVTTVQPGMEEAVAAQRHAASPMRSEAASKDVSKPESRSMLRMFSSRPKKSDSITPTKDDVQLASGRTVSNDQKLTRTKSELGDYHYNNNMSPIRSRSPNLAAENRGASPPSTRVTRNKDKQINVEAKRIRSNIGATEFEIEQLAKSLRGAVGSSSTVAPGGASGPKIEKKGLTAAEYSLIQEQQSELHHKLRKLMQQYQDLTGSSYEELKEKRSTFSRFRSKRSKMAKLANSNVPTDFLRENSKEAPSSLTFGEGTSTILTWRSSGGLNVPSHWRAFSSEPEVSMKALVYSNIHLFTRISFWRQVLASFSSSHNGNYSPSNEHVYHRYEYYMDVGRVLIALFIFSLTLYSMPWLKQCGFFDSL